MTMEIAGREGNRKRTLSGSVTCESFSGNPKVASDSKSRNVRVHEFGAMMLHVERDEQRLIPNSITFLATSTCHHPITIGN